MSTDSEYDPSEADNDDNYLANYLGGITDEEYATEEEGGTFFDDDIDPVALLEGMEHSDRQPFEVLAIRRRRRRSRRLATVERPEQDEDEEEESESESEENEGEDEEQDEEQRVEERREGGGIGQDTEMMEAGAEGGASVQDKWSDELAQKLGLQPVTSRRKQRQRERYRRRSVKRGTRRKDIPEEAARKLGEANLYYANAQHQEAISVLMEVIRLAPNLADPYHVLGVLHETVGNSKKALDFFMIAAHLTPKDLSLWKRLAAMSTDHHLVRQAVYCYSQVLKRDREDVDARFDRALLYAELEDHKKAVEGFEQVRQARPDHPEAARALARVYYRTGQPEKATEVLQAFLTNPKHVLYADLTHANILAELLSEQQNWPQVLKVVALAKDTICPMGEELPMDLKVKAGIAQASMGELDKALTALEPLFECPVDSFADLYLEVAAHMESLCKWNIAEQFLRPLAQSEVLGGPEVWSRIAECKRQIGGAFAAAQMWEDCTQDLATDHPGYVDAMVCLAEAHREAGDDEAAAAALSRLEESLPAFEAANSGDAYAVEEHVLRRATILLACGKRDMFLDVALPAIGSTLRALSAEAETLQHMDAAARRRLRRLGRNQGRGIAGIAGFDQVPLEGGIFKGYTSDKRKRNRQRAAAAAAKLDAEMEKEMEMEMEMDAEAPAFEALPSESEAEDEPTLNAPILPSILKEDRPFTLVIDAARTLLDDNRPVEARELAQAMIDICGRRFSDRSKRDILKLLLFEADLAERDFSSALINLKSACSRWPRSPIVWNALSRHLLAAAGTRQAAKFLSPLRNKHPTAVPVALALGHCHLLNYQYADALGEYFHALRAAPDEPLVLLCIGVAMVNKAATRKVADRHGTVLQAFAYLQDYAKKRFDEREGAYNLGRAAHQLGLLHIAAPLYKRALEVQETKAHAEDDGEEDQTLTAPAMDVRREAAYNLALIYQASGATPLARKLLRDYVTI